MKKVYAYSDGSRSDSTVLLISEREPIFIDGARETTIRGILMTDLMSLPQRWVQIYQRPELEMKVPANPHGQLLNTDATVEIRYARES